MRLQSMIGFSILFIGLIAFPCLSIECFGADSRLAGNKLAVDEVVDTVSSEIKDSDVRRGKSISIIYSANMKAVITPCG